jgi:hypothetical protein
MSNKSKHNLTFTTRSKQFIRPNNEKRWQRGTATPTSTDQHQGYNACILMRCGASPQQRVAIIQEGFTGMADLLFMEESDIETMMSNITKLRQNQGGRRIRAILTKKVKALVFWAKEQEQLGIGLGRQPLCRCGGKGNTRPNDGRDNRRRE